MNDNLPAELVYKYTSIQV